MNTNTTVTNKANIQPMPTDRYIITTSDVTKYLQDQLGFGIVCDYTRWTGVSPDKSYVRMRAVFNPDDIVVKPTGDGYVDKFLAMTASGIDFKDTVIDILTPFMYPDTLGDIYNRPDDLRRLYEIGLYDERLVELIQNAKLNYCREVNLFRLYLRPERIITDMLKDPSTNEIDGHAEIIAVAGMTSDTIRWEVAKSTKKNSFTVPEDINMDAIFDRR